MKKSAVLAVRLESDDRERLAALATQYKGLISESSIARLAILEFLGNLEKNGNDLSIFLKPSKSTGEGRSGMALLRENPEIYKAKAKQKK